MPLLRHRIDSDASTSTSGAPLVRSREVASVSPSISAAGAAALVTTGGEASDVASPVAVTRSSASTSHAHAHEGLGLRRISAAVSQLLGTHALAAAVGLASIPIVARNLGPAGYGQFSLFVLLLGIVTYQDFIRPLLIRQWSASPDEAERERLAALSLATTCALACLAAIVGFVLLPWAAAIAFALAAGAHSLASVDYARLAATGRVGTAGAIRNVAFAGATGLVAALSFVVRDHEAWLVHAYAWPFVVGNVAILITYRVRVGGPARWRLDARARLAARDAWREHRGAITSLVGFGLATAVVVSTDRVMLEHVTDDAAFGAYAACADLAVKLTIVGTALGMTLYPALSRAVTADPHAAAKRFVHVAGLVMCGWFALILGLVVFHREVVRLVLGPAFVPGHALYAWILVGVFVHMLGFLLTPWQRARGEFGVQTRAYWIAGIAMVAVGFVAIPRYGAVGAVACYLTGHAAEVLILSREARSMSRETLPRWKLATLAVMVLTIGAAAWLTSGGTA